MIDQTFLDPWAWLYAEADAPRERRKAKTETASNDGDTLNGTSVDDRLFGGRGDDLLRGLAGDDRLIGRAGDDRLIGGSGNDFMVGSSGEDLLKGGGGADTMKGGGKADDLRGGGGADSMKGGGGADKLNGGGGDDFVDGGGGADTMFGNRGSDTLKGGNGADVFRFAARDLSGGRVDTILDLGRGADKIDLTAFSTIGAISQLDFGSLDGALTINIGGGRIKLQGVTNQNQLSADQFLFNPNAVPPTVPPVTPPVTPPVVPPVTPPVTSPVTPPTTPPASNDTRVGSANADVIPTGPGSDTLIGNAGADVFDIRLENGSFDTDPDVVSDFNYTAGDRIGLNAALAGVSFDTIDEVVSVQTVGGNTEISIRRADSFETALILEGVSFTLPDLSSYGFELAPRASAGFVENPYGFQNNNAVLADPDATRDGLIIAYVDQTNVDNASDDFSINSGPDEANADLDIFVRNTATGATIRASADGQGNTLKALNGLGANSHSPSLSADGRWIAFATNGIGAVNDQNTEGDIYVRDLANDGTPILVTVGEDGLAAGGVAQPFFAADSSAVVALSGDGRKVAFVTTATFGNTFVDDFDGSILTADTNNAPDVYLKDLDTGEVTLVSKFFEGPAASVVAPYEGSDVGDIVAISEDGRYVAFLTERAIAAEEGNFQPDVYLYDSVRDFSIVVTADIDEDGFEFGGDVFGFDMSASGDRIAFLTGAALDTDDTNGQIDVYVADIDLETFRVTDRFRVSEAPGGLEITDFEAKGPIISPDGQRVAWATRADDVAFFDPFEVNSNGERIFVNDLATGDISTIDGQAAQNGFLDSEYGVFTDDAFIYRIEVPAAPGGARPVSETLASEPLVLVEPVEIASVDIPEAQALSPFSTKIRSSIETPGDTDLFRLNIRDGLLQLSVEGVSNNGGTLPDPVLNIYVGDVDGFPDITPLDDFKLDDRVLGVDFDPLFQIDPGFEQLFLEVSGFNQSIGTYTLQIEPFS